MTLIGMCLTFIGGLVVGWTIFPQPKWANKILVRFGLAEPSKP